MLVHNILVLVLCANLALTSSVSNNATDGPSKNNRDVVPAKNFHDNAVVTSTTIASNTTDNIARNEKPGLIMSEGGPIYQSQSGETLSNNNNNSTIRSNATTESVDKNVDVTTIKNSTKLAKTRNASVVPRKGVPSSSKITARKGVGPESSSTEEVSRAEISDPLSRLSSSDNEKLKKMESISTKMVNDTQQTTTNKMPVSKATNLGGSTNGTIHNIVKADLGKNSTMSENRGKNVTTEPTIDSSSTSTSTPTTKRFKPKPTVTIGEMDVDKPIPASPTKTPPLGMPRKIDYIVPVIITIMALPLLGGVAFFMYRRGRDCWDKRHYRRMDFLIDGMYNDHSWK